MAKGNRKVEFDCVETVQGGKLRLRKTIGGLLGKLCFALIPALISYGLFTEVKKQDLIDLKEIAIKGASPQTEARVREKLKFEIGKPIWKVSMAQAFKVVTEDPWVDQADIRRQLPHTLKIEIVEKKPFAVAADGKGQFSLIDERNSVIARADISSVSRLPILMGMNDATKIPVRERAVQLLKELPEEGILSRRDVSDISFDDEKGFQLTLSKTGMVVEIGRENIPLHLDRARKVAQYLDQHHINAMRIDSDYSKKVLVKLKRGR